MRRRVTLRNRRNSVIVGWLLVGSALLSASPASASTFHTWRFASGPVELFAVQTYYGIDYSKLLYQKGLAEALGPYVEWLVLQGHLEAKPVRITCENTYVTPAAVVNQGPDEYTIRLAGLPDLRQLARILLDFGEDDWEPFEDLEKGLLQTDAKVRQFQRRLDRRVGEPDLSFFEGRRFPVLEVGDLKLIFEKDQLFYELSGQRLSEPPEDPVAVRSGERYFIRQGGEIVVYEEGAIVDRHSVEVLFDDIGPVFAASGEKSVDFLRSHRVPLTYRLEEGKFVEPSPLPEAERGAFEQEPLREFQFGDAG